MYNVANVVFEYAVGCLVVMNVYDRKEETKNMEMIMISDSAFDQMIAKCLFRDEVHDSCLHS